MRGVNSSCDASSTVLCSIRSFEFELGRWKKRTANRNEDCEDGVVQQAMKGLDIWTFGHLDIWTFKKKCWRFRKVLTPHSAIMDREHNAYASCNDTDGISMLKMACPCGRRLSTTDVTTPSCHSASRRGIRESRQARSNGHLPLPIQSEKRTALALSKETVMTTSAHGKSA